MKAPVEDRRSGAPRGSGYTVQRGDTLYSIAFRYGMDYRKMAAANALYAPYTIFPGQKLLLRESDVPLSPRVRSAPPATSSRSTGSKTATARKPASVKPGGTRVAVVSPPVAKTPAAVTPPKASVTPPKSSVTKSSHAVALKAPASGGTVATPRWRWPSTGRVIRSYSSSVHKGIDLGGNLGDAVQAVEAGKVVYAGTGIVGLGELLIVKHNETYLSAYGHNKRLLVAEGDIVKAGQKIAEKGHTGTDSVKLHFEIRRAGKPVDPVKLLPKR